MKPSHFIPHYERMLGRSLSEAELAVVLAARASTPGKSAAVKAMRAALEHIAPDARPGHRDPHPV